MRSRTTVIVARRDATIRAGWILVAGKGEFVAGAAEQLFKQTLTITLGADSRVACFADQGRRSFCEHRPRPFWIVRSGPRPASH